MYKLIYGLDLINSEKLEKFKIILNQTHFIIVNEMDSQKKTKFLLNNFVLNENSKKYLISKLKSDAEKEIERVIELSTIKNMGKQKEFNSFNEKNIVFYGDYKKLDTLLNVSAWNGFIECFSSEMLKDLHIKVSSKEEAEELYLAILYKKENNLIFNSVSEKIHKQIGILLIYSLNFLQKNDLNEEEINKLKAIKNELAQIITDKEVRNTRLETRIFFHIYCIDEKIIQFSPYSQSDLNKVFDNWLKLFLKYEIFQITDMSFFISTPLRMSLYNYLMCIKKMVEFGEKKWLGDKKKFYQDFIEKSPMVMGTGYFNGHRPITLNLIHKFIEKYKDEFQNYVKFFEIQELYKYFFEFFKIQSLFLLNYSSETAFKYETETLINGRETLVSYKCAESNIWDNTENNTAYGIMNNIGNNFASTLLKANLLKIELNNLRDNKIIVSYRQTKSFNKTDYIININKDNLIKSINEYKEINYNEEINYLIKSSRILLGESFSKDNGNYYCRFLKKEDKFFIFEIIFLYFNQTESFKVALTSKDFTCVGEVFEVTKK